MPTLDSWISVNIQAPFIVILVIFSLVIIGFVFGMYRYRKLIIKAKKYFSNTTDEGTYKDIQSTHQEDYQQFIYNLSHEVSNPLQIIQTNLDNMANCTIEDIGHWNQYQKIIETEIKRLSSLTENLRLLSRLESPGEPLKRESVNLRGVIESVIMAQVEIAESKGVHLVYRGPNRPARVLGNRNQLVQVITNLIAIPSPVTAINLAH